MGSIVSMVSCKNETQQSDSHKAPRKSKREIKIKDKAKDFSSNKDGRSLKPSKRSNFELKEIPVKSPKPNIPDHFARVNEKVQAIAVLDAQGKKKLTKEAILGFWDSHFAELKKSSLFTDLIDSDANLERVLFDAPGERILDELIDVQNSSLTLQQAESLYGLYMALSMSASEGAHGLDQFFQERAGDSQIKKIDVYLYRLMMGSLEHLDSKKMSPSVEGWNQYANIKNPIFRIMALHMGDQIHRFVNMPETGMRQQAIEKYNAMRIKYYSRFLNDDLQFIRIDALRHIAATNDNLAGEVIRNHRNSNFASEDEKEINAILVKMGSVR